VLPAGVGVEVQRHLELRSSPTLEGRCCTHPSVNLICAHLLRSSPTLEGRCCTQGDTGKSCLCPRCCDPHRPWRAGAAPGLARRGWPWRCSCDPHRPWRAGAAPAGADQGHPDRGVAILTDPGGPVLPAPASPPRIRPRTGCDPHRPWRAGAAPGRWGGGAGRAGLVAILTDPGGPVLRPPRCWPTCPRVIGCDPHRPWRAGAAIAAQCDKLGPCKSALRSSPTLEGRCCTGRSSTWTPPGRRCDPHRPWRAGAAWCEHVGNPERRKLRSSPTLEGRCCRLG